MSDLPPPQMSICKKPYDKNVVTPEKIERVWLPLTQIFFCLPKLLTEMPEDWQQKM